MVDIMIISFRNAIVATVLAGLTTITVFKGLSNDPNAHAGDWAVGTLLATVTLLSCADKETGEFDEDEKRNLVAEADGEFVRLELDPAILKTESLGIREGIESALEASGLDKHEALGSLIVNCICGISLPQVYGVQQETREFKVRVTYSSSRPGGKLVAEVLVKDA